MPEIEVEDASQIKLVHSTGKSSVTVSLKGGTIISWKIFSCELLYLSPLADTDVNTTTPIRGGIPIVFPQFNNTLSQDMPKHGFARICTWEFKGQEETEDEDLVAIFQLKSNEQTKKYYPRDFNLILQVTLGMTYLQTSLVINNCDEKETLNCHALFHNYMHTDNIDTTVIAGLKNIVYTDAISKATLTDRSALLPIADHIDRVYYRDVHDEVANRLRQEEQLTLGDGGNAEIVFKAIGCANTVVWNPYAKVEFKDMPSEDYKKFVCVEFGNVDKKMVIKPQETTSISQRLMLKILADSSKSIRAAHAKQANQLYKETIAKKEDE